MPETRPLPGTFGLTTIHGFSGMLVGLGQIVRGDRPLRAAWRYRHAFLVLDNDELIEAEPGGARIVPLSNYDGEDVTYSSWDLTDEQRAAIVQHGRAMARVGYDWLTYASLVLHGLHIRPGWVTRRVESNREQICSELCDRAYTLAGLSVFDDGRTPGDVTPANLALALEGPVA
jgi:uncharacterized protein YycO